MCPNESDKVGLVLCPLAMGGLLSTLIMSADPVTYQMGLPSGVCAKSASRKEDGALEKSAAIVESGHCTGPTCITAPDRLDDFDGYCRGKQHQNDDQSNKSHWMSVER
jgi:hypothetical protein